MRNREGKLYATFFFEDDITLIEKIIVNGKHSQEVTVCLFKWLMLSATFDLINTYMVIINMLTINDFSIMYLNFALILPISIFYGAIESRNSLNFHKPANTLFHRKVLFVYIVYFAMAVGFIYMMSQYFYQ
jgi:magnesium-transporting ATPase (P-type)